MLKQSRRSSASMPMDAYRHENHLVIHFDLPGVKADTVELHGREERAQGDGAASQAADR
jgi:HSP20 family molecular chaperone IbpA